MKWLQCSELPKHGTAAPVDPSGRYCWEEVLCLVKSEPANLARQNPCHFLKNSEHITQRWQKLLTRNSGQLLLFPGGLVYQCKSSKATNKLHTNIWHGICDTEIQPFLCSPPPRRNCGRSPPSWGGGFVWGRVEPPPPTTHAAVNPFIHKLRLYAEKQNQLCHSSRPTLALTVADVVVLSWTPNTSCVRGQGCGDCLESLCRVPGVRCRAPPPSAAASSDS